MDKNRQLTEDMIRITTSTIGDSGRALRERPLRVFIGHHALLDARGRPRRFTRRSTAMAAARAFIAEHNQVDMQATLAADSGCGVVKYDQPPAAPPLGDCEFCGTRSVPLTATLDADPDQRVCAACHADPRVPSTEAP